VSALSAEVDKVAALRLALPALGAGVYLNTGSCGPLPAETAAAMAEVADWELRLGRASPDTYYDVLQRMEEARASIAAIIGADTRDLALTHAVTEAMNVAIWGIDWRPGERAVSARNFEHAGGLSGLYAVRDRLGVDLELVDIGAGGDRQRVLAAFDAAIIPGTRLVSVCHVSHATGAVLPIAEIAEIAHARGALLAVDGAQAVGALPVDVQALGADVYAIAGQKWLLGPEGTGALYVAPAALDRLGDDLLRRRVRHVVTENDRVLRTAQRLRTGQVAGIGDLLTASHRSLAGDFEVSCPELDLAVDSALQAGAVGARMTGGGFGGSAVAMVPHDRVEAVIRFVTGAFDAPGFTEPVCRIVRPAQGARAEPQA